MFALIKEGVWRRRGIWKRSTVKGSSLPHITFYSASFFPSPCFQLRPVWRWKKQPLNRFLASSSIQKWWAESPQWAISPPQQKGCWFRPQKDSEPQKYSEPSTEDSALGLISPERPLFHFRGVLTVTVLADHIESNLLPILLHSLSPGTTSITRKESRLQHG